MLIKANTGTSPYDIQQDMARFNRQNFPVNVVTPTAPQKPAILMDALITAGDALKALEAAQ